MEDVRLLANEYNTGIHIHVSETQKEINDSLEAHDLRPFEYLDSIGFLGPDVVAAHSAITKYKIPSNINNPPTNAGVNSFSHSL